MSTGQPLRDETVVLMVEGVDEQRTRTDSTGTATFRLQRNLAAGVYHLSTVFDGSRTLVASSATADLIVEYAKIEIHTVPPLPDVLFSLDGNVFKSDKDGIVRIDVSQLGSHRIAVMPPQTSDENVRVEFSRWGDNLFVPYREVKVPLAGPLEVGFNLSYQFKPILNDHAGHAVDPERITAMTIKGSNGLRHTFTNIQPHWLQASNVVLQQNRIAQNKVQYTIESVIVDGSNVVNSNEQVFVLDPTNRLRINSLLASAMFSARDMLFGFPIGAGVHIEYPLGRIEDRAFGPENSVKVESLVSGTYRVNVTGAAGISRITLVDLKDDQDVHLVMISYLDIGVVVVLFILVAGLLLGALIQIWRFYGRQRLQLALLHPRALGQRISRPLQKSAADRQKR
jgi:hypothetical protein